MPYMYLVKIKVKARPNKVTKCKCCLSVLRHRFYGPLWTQNVTVTGVSIYILLGGPSSPNPDFGPPMMCSPPPPQSLYLLVGTPDAESGCWLLRCDKDAIFGLLNRTVV